MPFSTLFRTNKAASIEPQEAINTSFLVEGMKCAGCVQAVEKQLLRMDGVQEATVNLVTQNAKVSLIPDLISPSEVALGLTESGFPTVVNQDENRLKKPREKETSNPIKLWIAIALVIVSALGHLEDILPMHLPWINAMAFHGFLATFALLWPGRTMIVDGAKGLLKNRPTMDTLVSMGSVTAYLVSLIALIFPNLGWDCFFDAPVMIIGLILLGRTLEGQARARAKTSFESLLSLQSTVAYRLSEQNDEDVVTEIPVESVQPGDRLQVYLGDRLPVDGIILSGQTWIDESMLTGESTPAKKSLSDNVSAGTLNQGETIQIQATRTGSETTLANIIRMVEDAQTRKAPIQGLADKIAGIFTYGVMAIALGTFLFWWGIGTHLWPQVISEVHSMPMHAAMMTEGHNQPLLVSIKLAIAVLVIACPCALGLATPTAILVGTSIGAERGLLINGGDVLEKCHQLKTIVFDKTGTLTTGQLKVTDLYLSQSTSSPLESSQDLLTWIASVEKESRHPLALAIRNKAEGRDLLALEKIHQIPGLGLEAHHQGQSILVGSQDFLQGRGIAIHSAEQQIFSSWMEDGKTVVFCSIDQHFVGAIACQDALRSDAATTIQALKSMDLEVKVLTGDRQENTQVLLKELDLQEQDIESSLSPEEKLDLITQYQSQGSVAMVGDGINDAPALAQADVGIALSSGTDMAMETAQIVLTRSQINQDNIALTDIIDAIKLSQDTFQKIKQNLFWAFVYNLVGIPIAAGILLPHFHLLLTPAASAALMASSSVSVITNSLLLQWRWKSSPRTSESATP